MLLPSSSSVQRPGSSRIVQLDVLRGLAILMVLFRHGFSADLAGPVRPVVWHLFCASATGIDLFFILSGFLIGGLLFKELRRTGRIDVRRFLIRRSFRIWPGYYAFVAFLFVRLARQPGYGMRGAWSAVLPNLLHLQNYLHSPRAITWSLAVQEHFYLALPLFLMLVTRRRGQVKSIIAVPVAAALTVVACTAMRVIFNGHRPFEFYHEFTPTHLRIDGLFFGVLLAYLHHFHHAGLARVARHRWALLAIGAAMISPTWFINEGAGPFTWTWNFTLLYVGYGCIVVAAVYAGPGDGIMGRLLACRPAALLAGIGVFSYSIYLWHYDAGYLTVYNHLLPRLSHWPMPAGWATLMVVHFALSIGIGIAAARLIELPAIALRDRLFPARAAAPTEVASPPDRPPLAEPTSEPALMH